MLQRLLENIHDLFYTARETIFGNVELDAALEDIHELSERVELMLEDIENGEISAG